MSDIISREKTLDAIRDADVFVFYDADTEIDDAVEIAIRCTKKSVIDTINDLPSTEPKTPSNGSITSINPENTHDRTMGDLISRQDAIKSMANAIWHYPNELYTGLNSYETCEALAKDGLMFLPSAEPEWLTDDDFETIRIHLNAYKEKLCNQQRWKEAEEYQRIIDRFMALASADPEWKKGVWICTDDDIFNCSECDFEIDATGCIDPMEYLKTYNFCPNCGADMREGDA